MDGCRDSKRQELRRKRIRLIHFALIACFACTGCSKNMKAFAIATGALLVGHLIYRGGQRSGVAAGESRAAAKAAAGAEPAKPGPGGTIAPETGKDGKIRVDALPVAEAKPAPKPAFLSDEGKEAYVETKADLDTRKKAKDAALAGGSTKPGGS